MGKGWKLYLTRFSDAGQQLCAGFVNQTPGTLSTMLTFYGYGRCSTCRKAQAWLEAQGHVLEVVDITETPPPVAVLAQALEKGGKRSGLINTSGQAYRAPGVKERLAGLSDAALLKELAGHGKLCKRPVVVADDGRVTVGFKEAVFAEVWS